MVATPTSKPILHAIAPRIAVGNADQTRAFYGRIGFACTHQEERFMIVERDGVQLHLHPSNEPPTRHGAFWIKVSNIEALYQEYLAANVITSSRVKAQPLGFKEFHICDPFETSLFSPRVSLKKRGVLNKPRDELRLIDSPPWFPGSESTRLWCSSHGKQRTRTSA